MLKSKTPLLVGLLVIAGAVAFVFTFGSLDEGIDTDEAYPVYALFDDATGLVPNSRVMLSGIEVGRLKAISLDKEFPELARVEILLGKDIVLHEGLLDPKTGVWKDGATAVRQQASLIGDYYVALSPGLRGPQIQAGGRIRNAISSAGLGSVIKNLEGASSAIFPKLESIADDIKSITGGLREALGEQGAVSELKQIRADVAKTTENVMHLSGELRSFLSESVYPHGQDVGAILGNVERATANISKAAAQTTAALDRIMSRLDRASAAVGEFVDEQSRTGDQAAPGTLGAAITSLNKNMAILEGTLESVRAITGNIEQGKGTVGKLLTDDKLIQDIEQIIDDVGDVTSVIGRTQVKIQFRADRYMGSGAFKSTVDFSLHPKPDKYYLIQLIDDPAGRLYTTRRVTTTNDPRVPPVLVEDVEETRSDFKVTAQVAKRWHALTFRYGVMESSGGLGLDLDLLDDALSFKLDLFEMGRNTYPRLRLLAQWEFLSNFFISAGIDDMLNATPRDWFVGVGIRFDDDDLKALLPVTPLP
ncbi:MAG: MCE family protein [Deltaproteobacteria bacterium]|nr:MAG: MCE family protein [Deltaproteobacteria bacterium]